MSTNNLSRFDCIINSISRHPYISAALLCVLIEVFTMADQAYMTPQGIMILSVTLSAAAYYLLREKFSKHKCALAVYSAVISAAFGILLASTDRRGGVLCAATVLAVSCISAVMYKKKLFTPERLTFMIIVFSFCMYACYVIYTLSVYRQTDVNYWNSTSGHAPYIRYMYEHNFALPDFDPREKWQFYHTPLFYWTSAALMKLVSAFGADFDSVCEVSQIVTLFSAYAIVIMSVRLFRMMGLKGYGLSCAAAVIGLSNTMLMLSSSISNDVMATAFELGAVCSALKWYRSRKYSDIIVCAFCFGLGIMTKLSAWMAAPAAAFIFLLVFFKEIKDIKKVGRNLLQYVIFLIISVPLALWFPIRNLVKFGVPLGWVPDTNMYIGKSGFFERMFTIGPGSISTPYTLEENFLDEYNPIFTLFKSTVDLQRFEPYKILKNLMWVTLVTSIILGVAAFILMIAALFRRKCRFSMVDRICITVFYFTIMISYIIFCFNYPYVCTQCIRYVAPVITIGAAYIGLMFMHEFKNKKITKAARYLTAAVIGMYAFGFVSTFLVLGFD